MQPSPTEICQLFTVPVAASCGEATRESVSELSRLDAKEIPTGYDSWVEKRQREYRAGRHHARSALINAGAAPADVPRGMDGLPMFPRGFAGSITHTGKSKSFVAAAVCQEPASIGLDAEFIRPIKDALLDTIMTPREQGMMASMLSAPAPSFNGPGELALLHFSAKEAFYKCVYPQARQLLGFHDVEVAVCSAENSFIAKAKENLASEIPKALGGRYLLTDALIVCGVTWSRLRG